MKTTALESSLRLRFLSILLLYSVVFASSSLMINALACHPDQIQALLQFKNEFDSESCNSSDYLKGVQCDNTTGAVTKLQLPSGCLSGTLKPNSILFGFHHLRYLNLSHNNFISSSLPFEFGNLNKLEVLSLSSNGFIGQVPSSFSNLTKLTLLDLSDNKLTGSFQFVQNLTKLSILDLSGNTLSAASLSSGSEIPPQLYRLMMKNCNISEFPKFLKTLQNLERLDISSNRIKGEVPEWLWSLPRLEVVNLSNNSFDGSMETLVNSSVKILQLGFNSFKGSFPNLPLSINILSAPNNGFTGNIPLSICSNRSFLDVLDLSFNQFTGELPRCLSNITIGNLRGNSLEGSIPDEFYRGASTQTFDVGYNRLVGKLPRSLLNCSSLRFLNVYHNRIEDTFPFWLKALPNLQALILRSNRFYGSISPPDQSPLGFPELRVLELSGNNFSGNLPSNYFQNWKASRLKKDEGKIYLGDYNTGYYIYQDSLDFQYKGSFLEQSKVLAACATINFSGNRFKGQIPESIGLLKALISLNLSTNAFIGTIPKSLANLRQLESLDLSSNQLSGNIPQELESLSFLAIINVSNNHLKGEIPKGPQISSQPISSFEGNTGLCGLPLQVSCFGTNVPPVRLNQEDEEQVLNKKAVMIGYGPGMLLGLAICQVIASYKPNLLLQINPFKYKTQKPLGLFLVSV